MDPQVLYICVSSDPQAASHKDVNRKLQSVVDADDDDVLVRSSVNVFSTINFVASHAPGLVAKLSAFTFPATISAIFDFTHHLHACDTSELHLARHWATGKL